MISHLLPAGSGASGATLQDLSSLFGMSCAVLYCMTPPLQFQHLSSVQALTLLNWYLSARYPACMCMVFTQAGTILESTSLSGRYPACLWMSQHHKLGWISRRMIDETYLIIPGGSGMVNSKIPVQTSIMKTTEDWGAAVCRGYSLSISHSTL